MRTVVATSPAMDIDYGMVSSIFLTSIPTPISAQMPAWPVPRAAGFSFGAMGSHLIIWLRLVILYLENSLIAIKLLTTCPDLLIVVPFYEKEKRICQPYDYQCQACNRKFSLTGALLNTIRRRSIARNAKVRRSNSRSPFL